MRCVPIVLLSLAAMGSRSGSTLQVGATVVRHASVRAATAASAPRGIVGASNGALLRIEEATARRRVVTFFAP